MIMKSRMLAIFVFAFLVSGLASTQTKENPKQEGSQREIFDSKRDADKDVQDAVAHAAKSHQRILLDVGGEWCSWCHRMDQFFLDNAAVSEFLHKNYIVVKVNYSEENKNENFLSRYPKVAGYPHFFVLESSGKFLHSQDTGELEEGNHYNYEKVFAFLKKWAPRQNL
jgi:thioredoxin-related protein